MKQCALEVMAQGASTHQQLFGPARQCARVQVTDEPAEGLTWVVLQGSLKDGHLLLCNSCRICRRCRCIAPSRPASQPGGGWESDTHC
jgi:hypothetical protein